MESMEVDDSPAKIVVRRVPVIFDKENHRKKQETLKIDVLCLVGKEAHENEELREAIKILDIPMRFTDDGEDDLPHDSNIVFVCQSFEGETFKSLSTSKQRILGPPCIIDAARLNTRLPGSSRRPVYCNSMAGLDICFTGFKSRDELTDLCHLVHFMGGSVKKDFGTKITHLVSKTVSGPKYRAAVALGLPIVSAEWVYKSWEKRQESGFKATDCSMNALKQTPFYNCHLTFLGFADDEKKHVEEIALSNGAIIQADEECCSHVVVASADDAPHSDSMLGVGRVIIVTQNWFWESVAMAACADESFYRLNEDFGKRRSHQQHYNRAKVNVRNILGNLSGMETRSQRKRSSACALADCSDNSMNTTSDVLNSLLEASIVSLTASPAKRTKDHLKTMSAPVIEETSLLRQTNLEKHENARRQIAAELLQTERNYVNILSVIITVFKEPLESSSQRGGPILPLEDVKTIFFSIPDILRVHDSFVQHLSNEMETWSSDTDLGSVVLEHGDNFLKVYPKFVNFFEMTKERIRQCEKQYPRFLAFLKWNHSKPQCGRQTLAELLIAPVQRIPRIILLLQEMLKHTPESVKHRSNLEAAIAKVKTIVSHINEDKRKTESQVQLFEMMREIDGCPADVLSSHRSFVAKVDAFEVAENLGSKGEPVVLFLLSDSCEIAKRRATWIPNPIRASAVKEFKHLDFIPLLHIKAALDIKETAEFSQLFVLVTRAPAEVNERMLVFRLPHPESSSLTKPQLLQQFQEQMTSLGCCPSPDGFVRCVDGQQLVDVFGSQAGHMDKASGNSTRHRTLHRAFRGAKHKAKKVRRAFSHHIHKTAKMPSSSKLAESPSELSLSEESSEVLLEYGGSPVKKRKFALKGISRSLGRSSVTLV